MLLLLGVAGVLLPVCAYFALHGAWADFFDATVGHNLRYATRLPLAQYPEAFWAYFTPCLRHSGRCCCSQHVAGGAAFGIGSALAVTAGTGGRPRAAPTIVRYACWCWPGSAPRSSAPPAAASSGRTTSCSRIPPVAVLAGMAVGSMPLRRFAAPLRLALRVALVVIPIAIGMRAYGWYYLPGDVDAKARRIYGANPVVESAGGGAFYRRALEPARHRLHPRLGAADSVLRGAQERLAVHFRLSTHGPFPDVRERQHAAMRRSHSSAPRFIVTVSESVLILGRSTCPHRSDRRDLASLVKQSYGLAAVVPLTPDGAGPLLTGERATELWRRDPFSCCSLVLWEKTAKDEEEMTID